MCVCVCSRMCMCVLGGSSLSNFQVQIEVEIGRWYWRKNSVEITSDCKFVRKDKVLCDGKVISGCETNVLPHSVSTGRWEWDSWEFTCFIHSPLNMVFSWVQPLNHVWLFATPWTTARQASLSIINIQGLLKLMSIESVMPSNHLILCRPLLFQPSIFPSIRGFSSESVLRIRWPKYWSFSFNITLSNEHL